MEKPSGGRLELQFGESALPHDPISAIASLNPKTMPDPVPVRIDKLSQKEPQRVDQLRFLSLGRPQLHRFSDDLFFISKIDFSKFNCGYTLRCRPTVSGVGTDPGAD